MVKHLHAPEEIFSELWLDFYQVALDGILSHVNNKANYLEDSKITQSIQRERTVEVRRSKGSSPR